MALNPSVITSYSIHYTKLYDLLAFAMDWLLKQAARKAFPWYYGPNGEVRT